MLERQVVEQRLAEYLVEALGSYKRRQYDVGEEALGTVNTPDVLFAAHIARTEDVVVLREAAEEHGNLQFAQGPQKTEIAKVRGIGAEVVLKLEALGVLVVHIRPCHRTFIGGVLVAEGHIGDATQHRRQPCVEGQHGREGRVSVEVALLIKFQQSGVDGAADNQHLFHRETSHTGTFHRSPAWVHNQRPYTLAGAPQQFKSNDAVLAPADGHQVSSEVGRRRSELADEIVSSELRTLWYAVGSDDNSELQERLRRFRYAVSVVELAEAVPIEFLPESHLRLREAAAKHTHRGRTGALPIADQFDHTDVEYQAVDVGTLQVEKRAPLHQRRGVKLHASHAEIEPHPQAVATHLMVIGHILKHRVLGTQGAILVTVIYHVLFNAHVTKILYRFFHIFSKYYTINIKYNRYHIYL